jgi:exoribonuclease-2
MQLFFEEDGTFKAGTILKKEGNAYQVELPTGRRSKVKGGHVFFEFDSMGAAQFIEQANAMAAEMDPGFLWEVVDDAEFGFADMANEYFTEPRPVESAATLIALHANPVYFYRKGRGRYKRAPEDILKRALEAVEKRKRQEERRQEMVRMMLEGQLPEEIAKNPFMLLLRPDKNGIEWKALNDASSETRQSPLRLLLQLQAIRSPWHWHVDSFYAENFPQGRGFPSSLDEVKTYAGELPHADVQAFSIDDSSTTEIDDATSITDLGEGKSRIGIHIAAPSLIIERDSPVDKAARARMSTVYAPGLKTTMLPECWIKATSLDAGRTVPCVSLYVTVENDTMAVISTETRVETVTIKDNLRYETFAHLVTEEAILSNTLDVPYAQEISFLWRFAKARLTEREEVRGKPEPKGRIDWYFALEGEGENATIHLKGRARGEPIDLLVAELMIFANSTWGLWLEEHGVAGIYRSQRMGRVRMSTSPGPHDGLGVVRYAWSTSPLRRYVDMVNQRQIIATALGYAPAYMGNDADFFTIVSQFDATYETFNDFQRKMERYWSLRWIEQEGLSEIEAIVVKEELVRIEGLPFMQRIPGLPELDRGQKIRLAVLGCDYIELILETKLLEVLDESEEVLDEELPDTQEEEPERSERPEASEPATNPA